MKKFKIAVCLSGITRYWKTTSKLFEYWNSIYDNVDYYYSTKSLFVYEFANEDGDIGNRVGDYNTVSEEICFL